MPTQTTILATPAAPAKDRTAELLKTLERGVKDVFTSGRYAEYLTVMSRFHRYSASNCALILLQRPDATRVAGMAAWNAMGRSVNKGETAISILAPTSFTKQIHVDVLDPHGRPIVDPKTGKPRQILRGIGVRGFRTVSVFDVSQTTGQPLPELAKELQGGVANFAAMLAALRSISPCSIEIQALRGNAKGIYLRGENRIVVKAGMSDLQTVKTIIHEVAHAKLHGDKAVASALSREAREVQAESVAFVVAQHLGLDTSEYSFDYLADWSSDAQLKELLQSLPIIQHEACTIIDALEQALQSRKEE